MSRIEITPVSFDYPGAAAATGLSADTIRKAVNAGELPVRFPIVEGRRISKPLILSSDLRDWIERSPADA